MKGVEGKERTREDSNFFLVLEALALIPPRVSLAPPLDSSGTVATRLKRTAGGKN